SACTLFRRRGLRRRLRGRARGGEIHLGNLARFFRGSKIRFVRFETSPTRINVVGKLLHIGVVVLQRVVVTLALDRDAVFRSRQLVLQAQEVLIRLQLRVVLDHDEQAADGPVQLLVGGDFV